MSSKLNDVNFQPKLVEPGASYFFHKTLQQCHKIREEYRNFIFNIFTAISIFLILGIFLLFKYKGKKTEVEKKMKEREKQYYILSKIKQYQSVCQKKSMDNISGLPDWNSEYDLIYRKLYV
tara:strand:- start:1107 stop:1469 length:363 start_codon:yes stop_codon:yes gene_type:complete